MVCAARPRAGRRLLEACLCSRALEMAAERARREDEIVRRETRRRARERESASKDDRGSDTDEREREQARDVRDEFGNC
jgi:hypothetical protein